MKAKKKPESPKVSEPAEEKRIRATLRSFMGWSTTDYGRHMKEHAPNERKAFLEVYGVICGEMRDEYVQWATNLLLHVDETGKKSTLQAAYDPDTAPEVVQLRGKQRLKFLQRLYDALPEKECKEYRWLLQPNYLNTGCMPDTRAAQVMYLLKARHIRDHIRFQKVAEYLKQQIELSPEFSNNLSTHRVLDMAGIRTMQALREAKAAAPAERPDSLFAQLLLNTSINRLLAEQEETGRLMRQAAVGVRALLVYLQPICRKGLGFPLSESDIKMMVLQVLRDGEKDSPSPQLMKDVELVMKRVDAVSDFSSIMQGNLDALNYQLSYRFLAAMCVAWSLRTKETHDHRIVGSTHLEHRVIGGSASEHDGKPRPSIMTYHRMQVSLMWTTGQLREIDTGAIDEAVAHREKVNEWWTKHFLKELRQFTLAQWAELTRILGVEDLDITSYIDHLEEQQTELEQKLKSEPPNRHPLSGTGYPGFGAEMLHATRQWLKARFGVTDETFRKWDAELQAARLEQPKVPRVLRGPGL